MPIEYQSRNSREFCFCQECCSYENYEDNYCQCEYCSMVVSDQEEEKRRKDIFKKISDFFQLPLLYSNMNITYFYNTNSILDYKYAENNKLTDHEISDI